MRHVSVLLVALAALTIGAPIASAQIPHPFGNAVAVRASDPANGTPSSSAFVTADEPGERGAAIAWRCMADGLNVVYLVGRAFDSATDRIAVRSAFDEAGESETEWTLMQGRRAVFLPVNEVLSFTEHAITGRRLVLHVTDARDGSTFTDAFNLAGLPAALDYILPCQMP